MDDWLVVDKTRFVVAPMVDASELAWRLLCRRHGAQLCYSPMIHSTLFTKDLKYRKDSLVTCNEDRPLIVQFCGNDPNTMVAAAKLAENKCDAIDINLGCPQAIAKRGKYGAFLQDDWELLHTIVKAMTASIKVPITCKVRIFENIDKTVKYALMLQEAGCKLLTVHGRTRDQKGPLTGIASWKHIKAVREAVSIPVFANGNIQCLEDVYRCLEYTKVDGVMSAEGILTNPALFEGVNPVTWDIAMEYLNIVDNHPCPSSYIRGHLFKIFHKIFTLESNNNDRQLLATAQNINDFKQVTLNIRNKYLLHHEGKENVDGSLTREGYDLILPPWICQPYVRITPEEHTNKMLIKSENGYQQKRNYEDSGGNAISRKKMKKLRRLMRRPEKPATEKGRTGGICSSTECPNPLGAKCIYQLCKRCCKTKCYHQDLDCVGHRIMIHTNRKNAKQKKHLQLL